MSLRADKLTRNFGEKSVIKDATFEIKSGERILLQGANGAGKTTLFRLLTTLITPNSGRAWINQSEVSEEPEKARAQLSWVPAQSGGFFPRLTGYENLLFFARLDGQSESESSRRIEPFKRLPVTADILATKYFLCSDGMKRLLAIMRAFQRDAPVILLDEPTTHLDDASLDCLNEMLISLEGAKTVLVASHSPQGLSKSIHRTLQLKDGVIHA